MRSRLFLLLVFFLVCARLTSVNMALASEAEVIAVIANVKLASSPLSKSELSLIFWRKNLYWPNGVPIRPVNYSVQNSLRSQFSKRVLNSLPESQTDYWNGLYYHGVSPPFVVHSNEAMLRYVSETTGAIGYIAACDVDKRVKVLTWIDATGQLQNEAPSCP